MSLDSWLILAGIGVTICTGIFTAIGSFGIWLVFQVFALRKEVALLKQAVRLRLHKPDDSMENTA